MMYSRIACLSVLSALVAAVVNGEALHHAGSLAVPKIKDVLDLQTITKQTETDPRIVGGQPVDAGDYPYYAHVANSMLCGGTLASILLTNGVKTSAS